MSSAKSTAEECRPGVLSIEQCQEGSRLLAHSSPAFICCLDFFFPCFVFFFVYPLMQGLYVCTAIS